MAAVTRAATAIRAVLFDLDDTLFAHREAVETGIIAYGRRIGLGVTDEAAEAQRWNALEEEHYHRYLSGELHFLQQRWERARAYAAPYGHSLDDEQANAWFDDYFTEYQAAWSLHPDALRCLGALRSRGLPVGLITNGDLEFQTDKIRRVELTDHLEHVVASGEFGVTKPDPRIFVHACALFGVAPAEAIYIGDRLQTDAIGAAAAGLHGVWIDRLGTATPDELAQASDAGVTVIRTLDEVPPLVG